MSKTYQEFLHDKTHSQGAFGFEPTFLPDFLFDFQKAIVEWQIRKGRSAAFADCGLGKTPMQLVVAENIVRHTNRPVLILTPLAVSTQTVEEAGKFDIQATRNMDGKVRPGINVTNYEKIHHFNPDDYAGVICDESSAIKAFAGKRRKEVTAFMRKTEFRHLYTATAAPNDYIELGTSSEALGFMGQMDMLNMFFKSSDDMNHVFFKNGDFWNTHKWIFKAHSETIFWRWVCSWARAIRMPSDLGFDDSKFSLPELRVEEHVVDCEMPFDGELFPRVAVTLKEQREERKITIQARCEKVARLVDHKDPAVVWCQMNNEGELLAKMLRTEGFLEVSGATSDDEKEEIFTAFSHGQLRGIITKPKIGAWGLNWQHCAHTTFFPSHSFEQYYQAIRRFWRFGQKRPVRVDIITTPGEAGVTSNLQRKATQADEMFAALVREMNNANQISNSKNYPEKAKVPAWL
jgi:SNF2 family DNA or RNA helicase